MCGKSGGELSLSPLFFVWAKSVLKPISVKSTKNISAINVTWAITLLNVV